MSTALEYRLGDIEPKMREWGFSPRGQGREHTTWRASNGKEILLKKGRRSVVNNFQFSEIVNILGISRQEFFDGPKIPAELEKGVGEQGYAVGPQAGVGSNGIEATAGNDRSTTLPPTTPVDDGIRLHKTRRAVINFLHSQGGSVSDPKGFATAQIREACNMAVQAAAILLKDMEYDGQIMRTVRGKRTYEIVLIEDGPGVQNAIASSKPMLTVVQEAPEPVVEPTPEPEPEPEILEPPAPVLALSKEDYNNIAEAVIGNLLNRLEHTSRESLLQAKLDEVQARLNRAIEYASGLRSERNRLRDKYEPGTRYGSD